MRLALLALALAVPISIGCATIPESGGGADGLPNAGAGPFRALIATELGNSRVAPNALDDETAYARDGSIVDDDGDPKTLAVTGYFAATPPTSTPSSPTDKPTAIARFTALDGRSFNFSSDIVLRAEAAWEGGTVGAPSALRVEGDTWLYYAAKGGIGLAKQPSSGHMFTREPGPVLGPTGGWEHDVPPSSPGVIQLSSGEFRMFYEVESEHGSSIGEARSSDGVHFTRIGTAPVLEPASSGYDAKSVGAPSPLLATDATSRSILRVYYTAIDEHGTTTVGLAGRYGDEGPLDRAVSPVFGTSNALGPHQPCVVAFADFTLLYATELLSSTSAFPATACAVAPATATLPKPNPP